MEVRERSTGILGDQEAYLAVGLRRKFPDIDFSFFEWISDPNVHCVIDDLTFRSNNRGVKDALRTLVLSCGGRLRVFALDDLSGKLAEKISSFQLEQDPRSTLIIFPGEGAASTRDTLPQQILSGVSSVAVEAQRIKDPQTNTVDRIYLPNAREKASQALNGMEEEIRTVLVIDDVIDTGTTLRALKRDLEVEKVGLQGAYWFAATPIMFSPLQYPERASESSVDGYEKIFVSLVLQGQENPVPLNSLSSFVEGGEKTKRLVSKCLNQYVEPGQIPTFINALLQLGRVLPRI